MSFRSNRKLGAALGVMFCHHLLGINKKQETVTLNRMETFFDFFFLFGKLCSIPKTLDLPVSVSVVVTRRSILTIQLSSAITMSLWVVLIKTTRLYTYTVP